MTATRFSAYRVVLYLPTNFRLVNVSFLNLVHVDV